MDTVSVIIPTYNEKENIIPLLESLKTILSSAKLSYELLVVDDNSPDGTGKLASLYAQKNSYVRVFIRTKNHGLGSAILHGIRKSRGDIIVGMDADFNHDPLVIPHMIKKLKTCQLVVGSRFVRHGGMEDKLRFVPTYIFNLFLRSIGFPIMDNTSGFYAIKKTDLVLLNLAAIYYGYGDYHLRLVFRAKKAGFKICEIPVYYKKRIYGKSKSRLFSMFFSYAHEAYRLTTNK